MKKRLISILLLCCLLLACIPTFAVSAAATGSYDAFDALDYAKDHWNDGVGLCAEFVSKCVQAGGIKIGTEYTTSACADAICEATGLSTQYLTLTNGYAMKAKNESILAAGDVVLQYCVTHQKSPHILICGGYDSEGYATFYAHNGAMNNSRCRLNYNTSYQHTTSCDMRAKVIHLTGVCSDAGCYGHTYNDMPAYWTKEHKALDFAIARGIINGTYSTKVSPYETMTRAQLVTIIYRMAGSPKISSYWTGPRYHDVRTKDWYYLAAVWAYHTGIMCGTGNNTFSPNATLNNETAVTVLYRYAQKLGHSITGRTSLNGLNVSDWAKDAYSWAVANSMIDKCDAKSNMTRASFAFAVYRYFEMFRTLK